MRNSQRGPPRHLWKGGPRPSSPLPHLISTAGIGVGAGKVLGVWRNCARILPSRPKNTSKQVISKKSSLCQFGRHYFQINACWAPFCSNFQGVLEGSQRFCPDCMGFCPDFHQLKILGVRLHHLHPRLLHQWPLDMPFLQKDYKLQRSFSHIGPKVRIKIKML